MTVKDSPNLDPQASDVLFEEAILAYLEAKQSGPVDKSALQSRYAPVAAELAEFFAAEEAVGAILSPPSTVKVDAEPSGLPTASPAPDGGLPPFGRYADFAFINCGGMGTVYRCRDAELGRSLAMKVMHPHLALKPESVRDFQEEAQVAGQLTHPNIAPVHERGMLPDGRPYFTMKLVEGRTLTVLIREYHAAPTAVCFDALLRHFVAVCNALAYAHQRQVLHRDLKPDNVMVGAFGEVQVMDWGLSKVVLTAQEGVTAALPNPVEAVCIGGLESPTEPGLVRGTFAYMSPEQAVPLSRQLDARCDVFALGAVLCEILTGAPPYTTAQNDPTLRQRELWEAARTCENGPALARLDRSGQPAELVALTKKCQEKEPGDRPKSAAVVAEAVTEYLAGVQEQLRAAAVERARGEAKLSEERKKRQWQVGLAAALLLLLTGGILGWLWYRYDREWQKQQRVVQEMVSNQRVDELLRDADQFFNHGAKDKALEAARRALALSQDERISDEKKVVVKQRVSELEHSVAIDEKDQQLQDRVIDLALPMENHELFLGLEPPDLDVQIESAFRQFGLDFSILTDQELLNHFQQRPEAVRNGLMAALDLWAIKCRQYPEKEALSVRLLRLARAIDPDPIRDELRQIAAELRVGTLSFRIWARMIAPVEQILPESRSRRLQDIARSEPRRLPPLTVQLLVDLLVALKETDLALILVRQALHANPGAPALHSTAAFLLLLGKKPRMAEAIVHLQSLRGQRPCVGSFLAVLLAKESREKEALMLCAELCRMQPDALMPRFARCVALRSLKRYQEAEQGLREAVQQHPDSTLLLSMLGLVLFEQKKWTEAEQAGEQALRLQPDYFMALNNHGLTLYGLKKYPEAEGALRKAIFQYNLRIPSNLQGPDAALFHSNLGLILSKQKKYEAAIAECRLAIRLNENLHFAHNNLGTVFAAQKKWAEAEAAIRKALGLQPDEPVAHLNLALALLKQKKLLEAELAWQEAHRLQADSAEAFNIRGMIDEGQKKYSDAEKAYRDALHLEPGLAEARCNLGSVYLQLKRFEEAEACCREAVRLAPDEPEMQMSLGFALFRRKKYAEAVVAYQKAIELDSGEPAAHSGLALVYREWGKRDDAVLAERRRAVALQPKEVKYRRFLAQTLTEHGKHEEAIAELRAALKINPDDADANCMLGTALLRVRRPAEAVEPLRRATKRKPTWTAPLVHLGDALDKTGKHDDALLAYQTAGNLNPTDADGLYWRSEALERMGRLREAEETYLRLVQLEPQDPGYRLDLGMVRFSRHRYHKAVEAFQEAVRLDPEDVDAHRLLGNALMELQRFPGAVRAYQKALEIDPKHPSAQKDLAQAFRRTGKFKEALAILEQLDRELASSASAGYHLKESIAQVRKLRDLAVLADDAVVKKRPADTAEWLLFAELCLVRERYAAAARYYAGAFDSDSERATVLLQANLLRAVTCAINAACGTEGTAEERTVFHLQALRWLQTEQKKWEKDATAAVATAKDREAIADHLRSWQETPLFESVRDTALAKLPEVERKAWQQLWVDVDALLKKIEGPAPKK